MNRYERHHLVALCRFLCAYCDCELGADWHADHVVPRSKGGGDSFVNRVPACPSCNLVAADSQFATFWEKRTHVRKLRGLSPHNHMRVAYRLGHLAVQLFGADRPPRLHGRRPGPRRRGECRAQYGSKSGWKTASAKFSATEQAGLKKMAADAGTSVDSVLHDAAVLHLIRNGYLTREGGTDA